MSSLVRSVGSLAWKWAVPVLAPVALVILALWGLSYLDKRARDSLGDRPEYQLEFAGIECPTPPDTTRERFLGEIQYLSDLPNSFNVLDDNTIPSLVAAFLKHPWVKRVERIEVSPKRVVRVHLTFRTPTLVVMVGERNAVVDETAILLPANVESDGLPELRENVEPPKGRAGTAWGDDRVLAVAGTLGYLRQHEFAIEAVQLTSDGIVLILDNEHRIVWGQPPGAEQEGESPAEKKVERLKAYLESAKKGEADDREFDVRRDPVRQEVSSTVEVEK